MSDQVATANSRKNKYKGYEESGRVRYDLVCIKDGSEHPRYDEGPFEVGADGKKDRAWQLKSPSVGRQQLIALLLKRDEDGNPIFFSKKPCPPVWHKGLQQHIPVPVVTPRIEEAKAEHMAQREATLADANLAFEARKAEAAAKEKAKKGSGA